jgi:hypothetical protein
MADTFELPPSPPTAGSGPVIDPSSTAVPAEPRPTAPAPPSATSSPWYPHFDPPLAAPAGPQAGTAPVRARRAANTRTRVIVGGTSVAVFLAILAAVGIHGRSQQPASTVSAGSDGGSAPGFDPGVVSPNLGQGTYGDPYGDPFARGFSGGGFSAVPGLGSGSAHTRSHGS